MTERTSTTIWKGGLTDGSGSFTVGSGAFGPQDVSWARRTEEPEGATSPEELIAAAHSTCYSMALSHGLAQAGNPPASIDTTAAVTFQPGTGITGVALKVVGAVPGITAEQFEEAAQAAKTGCPVSQALSVPITLEVHFSE